VIDCVTTAGFWDFMRHTRYAAAPVKPKIRISSIFMIMPPSRSHTSRFGIAHAGDQDPYRKLAAWVPDGAKNIAH
jgi:hypothetical protein